mgnify:CR=1 FL=1
MYCSNCGSKFEGRSNQIYCSVKCKQEAYRKRKASFLSDSFFNNSHNMPVYVPNKQGSLDVQFTNRIANNLAGSFSNGLSGGLTNGIFSLANTSNNPYYTIALILSAVVGGYVGYKMAGKDNKFVYTVGGITVGLLGGNLLYSLYVQFDNYGKQKQEEQRYIAQQNQNVLANQPHIYSSNDLRYMRVDTIRFDGVWGRFLGENINYGFVALVYGVPGGGKSHFATLLASYIEKIGKVLYVLAEEGITNSVQQRIARYNLTNTDFVTTRNENDVISNIQNYRWLIIDSINGMSNYNNHIDFIRKIKTYNNLFGIIVLNQVNKDGAFTGKNEVLHEVDIEINVEKGIAETRKNRFNISSTRINIFPDTKQLTRMAEYNLQGN